MSLEYNYSLSEKRLPAVYRRLQDLFRVFGFRLAAPFPVTPQAAASGKNIETPVVQSFFSPRTEEKHFCKNHFKQKQFTTYSDLFMKHKIYLL